MEEQVLGLKYEFGSWIDKFTEREQKEIVFDFIYAEEFGHGTDGHNIRMIVAKMARMLNDQEINARGKDPAPDPQK